MARQRRKNRGPSANTYQILDVQGPQKMPISGKHQEPETGILTIHADLTEQYLGSSFVGLAAALRVLSTSGSDELTRQHGYGLWRQMQRDPEVDAGLSTIIQGACAQPSHIISSLRVGDPDYKRSAKLAEFLNWMIQLWDVDQWKRQQLENALIFGNAVSELDWEYSDNIRYENKLIIKNARIQEPENYGFVVDNWGEIYGVAPLNQPMTFPMSNIIQLSTQGITNLTGMVPSYKLAIWTWNKRGSDPRGKSILIPAHVPWWSKQRALEEWSCWIGRYAQPSLVATPGPDAVAICIKDASGNDVIIEPTKVLLDALKNYGNASILALAYGSKVDVLETKGGVEPFIKSIQLFNIEISRALLGQHLATNEGSSNSRAAAEVHAIVLRQLINACRYFMARQFHQNFIKPVIEANFGDVGRAMPVVDLGDGDGYPPSITDVAVLLQSGYFTEDQLPKLDRVMGFPIRETNIPAGPQAISNQGRANATTDRFTPPEREPRAR